MALLEYTTAERGNGRLETQKEEWICVLISFLQVCGCVLGISSISLTE